MACDLTGSQILDCKDSVGGIKQIKVLAHPNIDQVDADFTISSGSITAVAATSRTAWYQINLEKENASANSNVESNPQNGTTFFNHEVKMMLNKMSARLSYEIHLYAKNRLVIAVRDMNDRYTIYGLKQGMDLLTSVGGTGQARGDRNGYELNFTGKEDLPEQEITSTIWDTLVSA